MPLSCCRLNAHWPWHALLCASLSPLQARTPQAAGHQNAPLRQHAADLQAEIERQRQATREALARVDDLAVRTTVICRRRACLLPPVLIVL